MKRDKVYNYIKKMCACICVCNSDQFNNLSAFCVQKMREVFIQKALRIMYENEKNNHCVMQ